ncbi:MAG: hypothetical protein ACRDX8_06265 [Acidimicrobiales bacterium]
MSGPDLIAHGAGVPGPPASQAASERAGIAASMANTESSLASISRGIAAAEARLRATTGTIAGVKIHGPGLVGHTDQSAPASGASAPHLTTP